MRNWAQAGLRQDARIEEGSFAAPASLRRRRMTGFL